METTESRAHGSLRRRVLVLALAAIGVAWVVAAAMAYMRVRHEADELLDGYLAQTAAILQARTSDDIDELEIEHVHDLHRYARRLVFQVWYRSELRLHSANAPDTPLSSRGSGFDDVEIDGRRYRVFAAPDRKGNIQVQVAEERHVRDEIAAGVGRALATPLVVALPALAVLLWFAVSTGMEPLRRLSREVATRDPANLAPILVDRPPSEIAPIVRELNVLFARVGHSLEHERRFTADAAHELRTPIAALRTQAEVARDALDATARTHALGQVIAGCDRAARLVDQMLTLARLEPWTGLDAGARCDLAAVARSAVAEAAPAAVARNVELDLVAPDALLMHGDGALLAILVRNLLDNAIRYASSGGHIRTKVERRSMDVGLIVEDDGPGVPAALLGRLGDRFFRALGTGREGSGLGLSIVKRIAEIHRAKIEFRVGSSGHGLGVWVTFHDSDATAAA